ncbi:hypothetical protein KAI78_04725 [bacterium]|nr:hypothetical protein [bacterium]
MKRFKLQAILVVAVLLVVGLFPSAATLYRTPYVEINTFYSNFLYSMVTGQDYLGNGAFYDNSFIYSGTATGISDGVVFDAYAHPGHAWYGEFYNYPQGGDGMYFEQTEYEQMFMGTIIISDDAGNVETFKDFRNTPFLKSYLVQNPVLSFEGYTYVWGNYEEPHYSVCGTVETKSEAYSPASGISITHRTYQYASSKVNSIFTWSDWGVSADETYDDYEDVLIKDYIITNNSAEDKEIYITYRADLAINTKWTTSGLTASSSSDGLYDIFYYKTEDNGEFNDYAAWQDPIGGLYDGDFGFMYDFTLGADHPVAVGIKALTHAPVAFNIVQYQPDNSASSIAGLTDVDNRLIRYSYRYSGPGVMPSALWTKNPELAPYTFYYDATGDPERTWWYTLDNFLKPLNPMDYFSSGDLYDDFVAPGDFDAPATVPGNYAIAVTVGPIQLDAGETTVVPFVIAGAYGDSADLVTLKGNLDTAFGYADTAYKTGVVGATNFYSPANSLDKSPSPKPEIIDMYEKYDVSDGGINIHIVWDNIDFGAGNDSVPAGCGYNLYYSTWDGLSSTNPSIKYRRLKTGDVTQLCGTLKGAPTAYTPYTDDNFIVPAEQFKSEMNGSDFINYAFALSSNDDAWWDSNTSVPQLESAYFNESMPAYYEFHLVPAAIDLEGEFAYEDNSNVFLLSWSSPASREKDLDRYELYRAGNLEESIYLQGGVYEFIGSDTTSDILMFIDGEEYIVNAADLTFNASDPLNEVILALPGFNDDSDDLIINNFFIQNIEGESPFTVSDVDTTQYKMIWTGSTTNTDVYWDTPTAMLWWEKLDDWGATYYLSETGTTKTVMYETQSFTIAGIYLEGDPETIIDYSDTPLAGDSSYQYYVKKLDFLTPFIDITTSDPFTLESSPDYPTNLAAEDTNKSITLTWDKAAGDIFRYYVYRCSSAAIYDSVEPLDEDYVVKIGAADATTADTYTFVDTYITEYATYYYFVTSFNRTTDLESQPSNVATVSKDFDKEQNLELAHCVPNPFIYGTADALQENNHMVFVQLTENATITIYDIKGGLIRAIEHSATSETTYGDGGEKWDLMNEDGKAIATGLYFYVITNPDDDEDVKKGKLVIVR